MANIYNTKTSLDGFYKKVYADDFESLPYENLKLMKIANFKSGKKTGKSYSFPIVPDCENGFAYAGPDNTLTLPDSLAGSVIQAEVKPYQGLLKSTMDYESAFNAQAKGPAAFQNATQFLFERMKMSHRKRIEIDMWYGQQELGIVSSISTKVITITDASFAPAIWGGFEGASVEIFDSAGTTQRNDGSGNTEFKITAVDLVNKTVTVESRAAGNAPSSVVATDRIFFLGQRTTSAHNVMEGFHTVATNSGSMWGVAAGSYSLWQGSSFACGSAALSMDKIFGGCALGQAKGLEGPTNLYCSNESYRKLLTDQAALRRYGAEKIAKNGFGGIEFEAPTGPVTVMGTAYCKEGFAYMCKKNAWYLIGTTMPTFKSPLNGQIFDMDTTYAAVRVQSYHNLRMICTNPGHLVLFSGIA